MRKTSILMLLFLALLSPAVAAAEAPAGVADRPAVLGLKERAATVDRWLRHRLDTVLPEIMRREGIDMWLVICSEYNEDPVYLTLVPAESHAARRTTMLVFFDRGTAGLEKLNVGRYGIRDLYPSVWKPNQIGQWERLAQIVRERNPRRIGINESGIFAFGDGLSASHKVRLVRALGPELSARCVSAERLAVGWLERRTPEEIEMYDHICGIAHAIIAEAFSRKVITPGVTTTSDVQWWMREQSSRLGLENWFFPTVDIQRPSAAKDPGSGVILRGDLLHCDFGIRYLGLCTDTQELAYVLRPGEDDAPAGLKAALAAGNRLQDIHLGEFKEGRTGNEMLAAALAKAKAEGLKPSIYTHSLGFHGHGAGLVIGMWDMQEGVAGTGEYPLYADTAYAIELNVRSPAGDGNARELLIALEQDAVFLKSGPRYLDGRQTAFHLIR